MSVPVAVQRETIRKPLVGFRVLLVGRPSATRTMLRQLVEDMGADELTEVTDAQNAVLTLQLMASHLVISDAQLDGDRDGDQLLEELRLRSLLPPVSIFVLVTNERSQRKVTSYAELGPDACLVKPIDREDVVRRLSRLAARRRLMRAVYVALDDDRLDEAVAAATEVATAHPPVASECGRLVADRLIVAGRLDDADALVRRLMGAQEAHWGLLRLARIRYQQGRLPDAHRVLERLLVRAPDLMPAYDLMASVKEQLGRPDEAMALLEIASGRSAFNLARTRLTGELAMRSGDLARAEREFARVMERMRAVGLENSADYGNMISVLVARGKLDAAAALQGEQSRLLQDDPDTRLMQALVEIGKARLAGDTERQGVWLDLLVEMLPGEGAGAAAALQLSALEAVFDHERSDDGFRIAQTMIRKLRADRAALHRLRTLIDRRKRQPRDLMDVDALEIELDRFELEGWDPAAAAGVIASIEHWGRQRPVSQKLPQIQARFTELAHRHGLSDPFVGTALPA